MLLVLSHSHFVLGDDASQPVAVSEKIVRIPRAEGYGMTREAALNSAQIQAVQQATGMYITNRDVLTSESKDIKRETTKLSNGYILWFEPLDLPETKDGQKHVVITAEVSRERIEEELVLRKVWTRPETPKSASVGGRNLNARINSELRRDRDLANLLATWFSQSPKQTDMILGIEIQEVPEEPDKVAEFPKRSNRSHSKEYEYPVRCLVHVDPTSVVRFGEWIDRNMQRVEAGNRTEATYQTTAFISDDTGGKEIYRSSTAHHITIDMPTNSVFDWRRQTPDHPLYQLPKDQAVLAILIGLDFQGKKSIRTKWAIWTLPLRVMQQMQQLVFPENDRTKSGIAAGAYGVDKNRSVLSRSEGTPYFAAENCLSPGRNSLSVYSPLIPHGNGMDSQFHVLRLPYKQVLLVGSSFAELANIEDIEVSLLSCDFNKRNSDGNSPRYEKIGNSEAKPPFDLSTFLQQFDVETTAKKINRHKTTLGPNRTTDRQGNNSIRATLTYDDGKKSEPLANRKIRVLIEHPNQQPQFYGEYTTGGDGRINFNGLNGKTLRPPTKLHFEFAGDDEYAESKAEMGIR